MMNLKKMTALFALCSFGLGAAEVSMLNLNRIESSQGLPAGWYPNKRQEFSPLPKVEFPVEQDGKAMHISNIQGREGCRFDSYRVIPAEKGGKLVLTIHAKGRGTGVFTVQAYSGKKWTGHIGIKTFAIPAEWQSVKVEFDIRDLDSKAPTSGVICMFGAKNGSELFIRSLTSDVVAGK